MPLLRAILAGLARRRRHAWTCLGCGERANQAHTYCTACLSARLSAFWRDVRRAQEAYADLAAEDRLRALVERALDNR